MSLIAFTVSGRSSAGKGCTDNNAFWKTLNPFALEMKLLLDGFPSVSFVVDLVQCRDM